MFDREKLDGVMVQTTTHARAWVSALAMQAKPAPGAPKVVKPASRWPVRRRGQPPATNIWQDKKGRRFHAFVVTDEGQAHHCSAPAEDLPQMTPRLGRHLEVVDVEGAWALQPLIELDGSVADSVGELLVRHELERSDRRSVGPREE